MNGQNNGTNKDNNVNAGKTAPSEAQNGAAGIAAGAAVGVEPAGKPLLKQLSLKNPLVVIGGLVSVAAIAALAFILATGGFSSPTLKLTGATSMAASSREEFNVDVVLENMPADGVFPAASISVKFDKNKLEFTDVRMGTMETISETGANIIPTWSVNTAVSNQRALVNAMYLDMSGGDRAYTGSGYDPKSKSVVLRLSFKLRDSAQAGDRLELAFEDAVLAAIDNELSLSMTKGTLKTGGLSLRLN